MKSLIIIPAYNEAGNIETVVDNIKLICRDLDYLIVNDGSFDNTAWICEKKGYPLLNLPVNLAL